MLRLGQTLGKVDLTGVSRRIVRDAQSEFEVSDELKANPWITLSKIAAEGQGKKVSQSLSKQRLIIAQSVARLFAKEGHDEMSWFERVAWGRKPSDFQNFLRILGIEEQWRRPNWMLQEAHRDSSEGGVGISMAQLYKTLSRMFSTYQGFLLRMDDRLPFERIETIEDGLPYLRKEAKRLGASENEFSTLDAFLTQKTYTSNLVIQEIVESIQSIHAHYTDLLLPSQILERVTTTQNDRLQTRMMRREKQGASKWTVLNESFVPEIELRKKKTREGLVETNAAIQNVTREFVDHMDGQKELEHVDASHWSEVVRDCSTPRDYLAVFEMLNIPNDISGEKYATSYYSVTDKSLNAVYRRAAWKSTTWLRRNGFLALKLAIMKRFDTWEEFMKFLGFESDWDSVFSQCQSADSFRKIFDVIGVEGDNWQSRQWLQKNGFNFVYIFILKDKRFKDWDAFKKFMDLEVTESYPSMLAKCEDAESVHTLFEGLGIPYKVWTNSRTLGEKCSGMAAAIERDKRFSSFDDFMLFAKAARSWPQKLALCGSRADYLELFAKEGIPEDRYLSSKWLIDNGFKPVYRVLEKKHGEWKIFQAIMQERLPFDGIQSKQQALVCLRAEVLRLRATGKWINDENGSDRITKAEYEEIAQPHHYENNVVIRAVTDFFSSKGRERVARSPS